MTREEERLYDGELGWAYQVAMRILVKLGDLFGADKLIPITSAHISGVSYKTIGDAAIGFLEEIIEAGGKVVVNSTLNPSCLDLERIEDMGVNHKISEKQLRIIYLYERMGIDPILTCTPYYIKKPKEGSHLAWAESSAVIYANSIMRAWTNREGGPSALAAALIGKTPNYGMHRAENREANVLVDVKAKLRSEADFGALGIHVGRLVGDDIPKFSGLKGSDIVCLKHLGAAIASSGAVSIFHLGEGDCDGEDLERITVDDADIRRSVEDLSTTSEKPDMIFIGCPHCSVGEIKKIANLIGGKKIRKDIRLWICTSKYVRERSKPYVNLIERAGGTVLCGVCAVVTWLKELGVDTIMTNSAKTAYYAPTFNNVETMLAPLNECIEMACSS